MKAVINPKVYIGKFKSKKAALSLEKSELTE